MSETIVPTAATTATATATETASTEPLLPRVTIKFCTQCRWMLRAAYYAQELLQTFSLSLGEVALQPSTGGVFVIELFSPINAPDQEPGSSSGSGRVGMQKAVIWDRKVDGGFPETKELKRRVRDVIQPGRDLGHVDRHSKKEWERKNEEGQEEGKKKEKGEVVVGGQACGVEKKCEDCQ